MVCPIVIRLNRARSRESRQGSSPCRPITPLVAIAARDDAERGALAAEIGSEPLERWTARHQREEIVSLLRAPRASDVEKGVHLSRGFETCPPQGEWIVQGKDIAQEGTVRPTTWDVPNGTSS